VLQDLQGLGSLTIIWYPFSDTWHRRLKAMAAFSSFVATLIMCSLNRSSGSRITPKIFVSRLSKTGSFFIIKGAVSVRRESRVKCTSDVLFFSNVALLCLFHSSALSIIALSGPRFAAVVGPVI
jgi:hypothetical protein